MTSRVSQSVLQYDRALIQMCTKHAKITRKVKLPMSMKKSSMIVSQHITQPFAKHAILKTKQIVEA